MITISSNAFEKWSISLSKLQLLDRWRLRIAVVAFHAQFTAESHAEGFNTVDTFDASYEWWRFDVSAASAPGEEDDFSRFGLIEMEIVGSSPLLDVMQFIFTW